MNTLVYCCYTYSLSRYEGTRMLFNCRQKVFKLLNLLIFKMNLKRISWLSLVMQTSQSTVETCGFGNCHLQNVGFWLAGFLLSRLHALLNSHLFFLFLKCIVLFLLEYNCLTLLCQFVLYGKMNQLHICIYLCFLNFLPICVTSEHQQSPLCCTVGSH